MIGEMVDYIFKSSFSWFEVIALILTFNLVIPPGVSVGCCRRHCV